MQQPLVVGVDIAKKDFAVACRVSAATLDLGKFANNAEGYAALQAALERACVQHGVHPIQVVLEATGGYEAGLLAYAYEQAWGVSMPRPKGTRKKSTRLGQRRGLSRQDRPCRCPHSGPLWGGTAATVATPVGRGSGATG